MPTHDPDFVTVFAANDSFALTLAKSWVLNRFGGRSADRVRNTAAAGNFSSASMFPCDLLPAKTEILFCQLIARIHRYRPFQGFPSLQ